MKLFELADGGPTPSQTGFDPIPTSVLLGHIRRPSTCRRSGRIAALPQQSRSDPVVPLDENVCDSLSAPN